MYKFFAIATVLFFSFMLWVIYSANSGSDNLFFSIVRQIPYGDKLGHVVLFGMLALLCTIAFRFKGFKLRGVTLYYGATFVSVFAIGEEITQAFLPTRTFDLVDLLSDAVGIGGAILLCVWLQKKQHQKK